MQKIFKEVGQDGKKKKKQKELVARFLRSLLKIVA
jgi:hypothetical protein